MDQNNRKSMVGPALAGLVVGAIAGILLAPKSGKETREDLAKLSEKMKDDIVERLRRLSTITSTAYQEIVDTVVEQYKKAKEITTEEAHELKTELGNSYDRVKESIEEEKENDSKL